MNNDEPGTSYALALATELKWLLRQADITTSALSDALDIGQRTIGQWLNGNRRIPFTFVYSAALVMGARPSSLFRLADLRLETENPVLVTGNPEWRPATKLTADEISARSARFVQCVAAELRTQLSYKELSTRQVALRLGKAPSVAGEWLNGRKVVPVHFAYNVSQLLDVPINELVDNAEARIDLYPEDPDEVPSPEAALDTTAAGSNDLTPGDIGRRLRALLKLKDMSEEQGFDVVSAAAKRRGFQAKPDQWAAALNGSATPDHHLLAAAAEALDTPLDYLTSGDEQVTAQAEAQAALTDAAREMGITKIAARGASLSPETLMEIANLVKLHIPPK